MKARSRKKLIEVALPLDAINQASAKEKSIRHGHPSTLHLWWARRPLAAARAVIFAQMVDDPSAWPELFPTEEAQERERQRLFRLIEELVLWKNTTNEELLERAREEIRVSWRRTCAENTDHPRAAELFDPERLPAFHDPFAGGGSLPLEAQRLGLEAHASDLNPVAVLINKAMIEIPPKFAGLPPVNPESRAQMAKDRELGIEREWKGAQGLAEDVRYYGKWMRDEAEKRIGHLYPKVEVTADMTKNRPDLERYVGQELTVIAWLWARTVKSPNPAFRNVDVPLTTTFQLCAMQGRRTYIKPVIDGSVYSFTVSLSTPNEDAREHIQGTKLSRGASFRCLMSGTPISGEHIKAEGRAGRIGSRLMAIVAEGNRERVYIGPDHIHEIAPSGIDPEFIPANELTGKCRDQLPLYGIETFSDLFTRRQLVALTTLADLVTEAREHIATKCDDNFNYDVDEYRNAVAVYLGLATSRFSDRNNAFCTWDPGPSRSRSSTGGSARTASLRNLFSRQALPMVWDYAEANPFSGSGGGFDSALDWIEPAVRALQGRTGGSAKVAGAASQKIGWDKVISTDPPYYDNVSYADLSDFFYVWLRRSLRSVCPGLLATLAVPKGDELIASRYRHSTKEGAELFFLDGMEATLRRLAEQTCLTVPVTIYYAFKQSEHKGQAGTSRSGWQTFLEAVIRSGFVVTGTWPIRTELSNRLIGRDANALASSIVLVCRRRPEEATLATRRQFVDTLKSELPNALAHLQSGHIAPVDLAQAAIGPGMAVYTRYAKVVDATGNAVTVREALALINETLDEVLSAQEGDFDADTRWALAWFEQHGFEDGEYGVAETLSKAKNTTVGFLETRGVLRSRGGKVRLLIPLYLRSDWDPRTAGHVSAWLTLHHLIRVHDAGGEEGAATLVRKLGSVAETARELAYRLYAVAERTKRSREALWYNALVQSWPEIARLAADSGGEQAEIFAAHGPA